MLTIRVAILDDWPVLNHLYADMDGGEPLPPWKITELFDAIAQFPSYQIYIAEWQGEPVGTFSLLFIPTMMHRGYHKSALLDAVVVDSAHRGQGIGKAMMQAALQLSAEAGCYKVTLSSNLKRDRAHAFYQSLGFQQHGWSFSLTVAPEP